MSSSYSIELGKFPRQDYENILQTIDSLAVCQNEQAECFVQLSVQRCYKVEKASAAQRSCLREELRSRESILNFKDSILCKTLFSHIGDIKDNNPANLFYNLSLTNDNDFDKVIRELERIDCHEFDATYARIRAFAYWESMLYGMRGGFFGIIGFKTIESAAMFKMGVSLTDFVN